MWCLWPLSRGNLNFFVRDTSLREYIWQFAYQITLAASALVSGINCFSQTRTRFKLDRHDWWVWSQSYEALVGFPILFVCFPTRKSGEESDKKCRLESLTPCLPVKIADVNRCGGLKKKEKRREDFAADHKDYSQWFGIFCLKGHVFLTDCRWAGGCSGGMGSCRRSYICLRI